MKLFRLFLIAALGGVLLQCSANSDRTATAPETSKSKSRAAKESGKQARSASSFATHRSALSGGIELKQRAFGPHNGDAADVATGDLDGDGDLDAFVVNSEGPNWVYLNRGDGVFIYSEQKIGTASEPGEARLGDLDGDSDLDVYEVRSQAANKVWINDGNGHFSSGGTVSQNNSSEDAALGDIDGDGDLDAYTVNNNSNVIWDNQGDGTFADTPAQTFSNVDNRAVELGDLDNDGDLDAYEASCSEVSRIRLKDDNSDWGFTETDTDNSAGDCIRDVKLAKMDGDDLLDAVLVVNGSANHISKNQGSGSFDYEWKTFGRDDTDHLHLAQLDGTGGPDIITLTSALTSSEHKIWFNDGSGSLTDSGNTYSWWTSGGFSTGDFDSDGDTDLLAFVFYGEGDFILNDGTGSFDYGDTVGDYSSYGGGMADFDGDGFDDVAVVYSTAIGFYRSLGDGSFTQVQKINPSLTWEIEFGKIDGDDYPDFILTDGDKKAQIWLNDGSGTFSESQTLAGSNISRLPPELADFNADGNLDVFIPGNNGKAHKFWPGNGDGTFGNPVSISNPGYSSECTTSADFDADGDPDVFVGNRSGDPNTLWIYENGSFSKSGEFGTNNTQDVAAADLNGDDAPDVFEANGSTSSGQVNQVWINDNSGGFTKGQQVGDSANATHGVVLRDYDGDGDIDAFVGGDEYENKLWLNDGNAQFTDTGKKLGKTSIPEGVGDIDGNGRPDTVTPTDYYSYAQENYVWQVVKDPSIQADSYSVDEDKTLDVPSPGLLDNDSDPQNTTLTITSSTSTSNGSATVQSDGAFTYTPDPDYNGPDSFTYTAEDADGNTNSAEVSISVEPVNDAPTAVADDASVSSDFEVDKNATTSGNLLANDSDPEGDSLRVIEIEGSTSNVGSSVAGTDGGQFTIGAEGAMSFDPDGQFDALKTGESEMTSVDYTIGDGNGGSDGAKATVTVNGLNLPPTARVVETSRDLKVESSAELDASGTTDPDDDFTALDFQWSVNPPSGLGSSSYDLDSAQSPKPEFTPHETGVFNLEVTATDPGGGTDSTTVTVDVDNTPPTVALANTSYTTRVGESISFDATGSFDFEDDYSELDFAWNVTPPSSASSQSYSLTDATTATPTFTPNVEGTFSVEVTVTDSHGGTASAEISVQVENAAPEAKLEVANSIVDLENPVELDASGSSDPAGEALTYAWSIVRAPNQSQLDLSAKNSAQISVTPKVAGAYEFQITVTDGSGMSDSVSVSVSVNGPPVASVSSQKQVVSPGGTVQLSAEQTEDDGVGDGQMSYEWQLADKPADSSATLSDTEGLEIRLTPDKPGEYRIELVATDGRGLTDTASVKVTANERPVAEVQVGASLVAVGESVELDGTQSRDPDGSTDAMNYEWSITKSPDESGAELSKNDGKTVQFTPDKNGVYGFELVVTDAAGRTDSDTAVVRGNHRPKAVIERDSVEIKVGETVELDASSSSDRETASSELEFAWKASESPEGVPSLGISGKAKPEVSVPQPGEYDIQVTVKDEAGLESTDQMRLLAERAASFVDPTPGDRIVATSGQIVEFPVRATDGAGSQVGVEAVSMPEKAAFEDGKVTWDTAYPETGTETFEFETNSSPPANLAIDVVVELEPHEPCGQIKCGEGELCNESLCFKACNEEGSCSSGDRKCFGGKRCAESACSRIECGDGKTCFQGTCFTECEDDRCPGNQRGCFDGRCTALPCAGLECGPEKACNEGECVARSELSEGKSDDSEGDDADEDASPTFSKSSIGSDESESRSVVLKDLDGDGDRDLIVANNPSPNTVWENTGDGQFEKAFETPASNPTRGVSLGDLDGDNQIDFFAANRGEGNVVWRQTGDLEFEKTYEGEATNASENVSLGDLDGDNQIDAFVANSDGEPNVVLQNQGDGTFQSVFEAPEGSYSNDIALGDLNGDNRIDAYVANAGEDGAGESNVVWKNTGSMEFAKAAETDGADPSTGVALGDLDGDNQLDIFVSNGDSTADKAIANRGGLTFENVFSTPEALTSSSVALGDLDGDNQIDAVVSIKDKDQVFVWRNKGSFEFNPSIHQTGTKSTESVSLGDVDGDGNPDIVLAKKGEKNQVLRNKPASVAQSSNDSGGCSCDTASSGPLSGMAGGLWELMVLLFALLGVRGVSRRQRHERR